MKIRICGPSICALITPRGPRGFLRLCYGMQWLPRRKSQQPRQSAVQVDRKTRAVALRVHRHPHDLLDQPPQRVLGIVCPLDIGQSLDQGANASTIGPGHRWVEPHRVRGGSRRQHRLQVLPPCIERDHPVLDLFRGNAGDDRVDQLRVIARGLSQLAFQSCAAGIGLGPEAIALRGVF
ncbi:hypothetical protein [Paracoccus marcusii]|uniref:hypothetical protein n=1 Tax=Paracoccus marcusii TaxID=59779 RepID=UPI001C3C94A4|nr:hypothetical protein [Paracoccus marcusii]